MLQLGASECLYSVAVIKVKAKKLDQYLKKLSQITRSLQLQEQIKPGQVIKQLLLKKLEQKGTLSIKITLIIHLVVKSPNTIECYSL